MGAIVEIYRVFRAGGVFMYVIAAGLVPLGFFTVATLATFYPAVRAGKRRRLFKLFVLCTAIAAVGTVAVGAIGYFLGLSQMETALAHAGPEHDVEALRAHGTENAWYPLQFALAAAALRALVAVAGVLGLLGSRGGAQAESDGVARKK